MIHLFIYMLFYFLIKMKYLKSAEQLNYLIDSKNAFIVIFVDPN